MAILGVDQVSVAVENLDDATRIYEGILGLKATHDETVEDQGVKTRFFPVAKSGAVVEALLALGPDTPVGKFLAKRGPGVHHIAFRVDDLDAELARLKRQGVRMIDETPRRGADNKRIAFIHPKETGGVLIELCESPASHAQPALQAARPKAKDNSLDGWTMHGSIGRTS
ncbi:MAG: methylmalonyl-CoA epimerase [Thermoplasmatota archaeon]